MSGAALTTMLLVGGFVWGGFVVLAVRAVRREADKLGSGDDSAAGG